MRYNPFDGGPLDEPEDCDCDNCMADAEQEAYWESLLADEPTILALVTA